MAIEITIPSPGESITEVLVGAWSVAEGASVAKEQVLVVIETDKVNLDIAAPESGVISRILLPAGSSAKVGDVVALLEPGAVASPPTIAPDADRAPHVMPAAQRVLSERGLTAADATPTGPGGRLLKEDALRAPPAVPVAPSWQTGAGRRPEESVPMTPMRQRIAARLVQAQSQAALLTTFNEVDLSAVKALRAEHGEAFLERYGVKLGFMSFFVKAAVDALKASPVVNAEIREVEGAAPAIVYKNYYDIGVAVGGGKGLVVPVLRNAELLSFAEIELRIADLGKRAKDGKLTLDELQGGTFTISNGGIYGSMLSTPIVNPPQSAILGMHAIQDRAVVVQGQVVARPMMYVALTYDHRLIDGREAVQFLKRIKDCIESPARMLLEV